jgi:hypothetical protein
MRRNCARRYCLLSRALFFAALLLCFSPGAQGQDSGPISKPPSGLWQALDGQIQSLPQALSNFEASLNAQVDLLRLSNQSLANSNSNLAINNASLTESLRLSQVEAGTSERKSKQLQTDLDGLERTIIQARIDAKALELSLSGWKIAGCVGIVVGIAGLVYGLTR